MNQWFTGGLFCFGKGKIHLNKFWRRLTAALLSACLLFSFSATAINWNGSSSGGNGGGVPGTADGYKIYRGCVGFRFSVVNSSGGILSSVIDVFYNNAQGKDAMNKHHKYLTKYNKKQLKDRQNNGFSTGKTTANCYNESSMGFASSLPKPSGMGSWQNSDKNLNPLLKKLGLPKGISGLVNGDKVLVEPLYEVALKGQYHSLTVTELALYGKYLLGANSNGGSSGNPNTWGFISDYTNKQYPNELYTPNGQGLWNNASKLTSRATFHTLINSGYGVGIAYTSTKPVDPPKPTPQPPTNADIIAHYYVDGQEVGQHYGSSSSNFASIVNQYTNSNNPAQVNTQFTIKYEVRVSGGSNGTFKLYFYEVDAVNKNSGWSEASWGASVGSVNYTPNGKTQTFWFTKEFGTLKKNTAYNPNIACSAGKLLVEGGAPVGNKEYFAAPIKDSVRVTATAEYWVGNTLIGTCASSSNPDSLNAVANYTPNGDNKMYYGQTVTVKYKVTVNGGEGSTRPFYVYEGSKIGTKDPWDGNFNFSYTNNNYTPTGTPKTYTFTRTFSNVQENPYFKGILASGLSTSMPIDGILNGLGFFYFSAPIEKQSKPPSIPTISITKAEYYKGSSAVSSNLLGYNKAGAATYEAARSPDNYVNQKFPYLPESNSQLRIAYNYSLSGGSGNYDVQIQQKTNLEGAGYTGKSTYTPGTATKNYRLAAAVFTVPDDVSEADNELTITLLQNNQVIVTKTVKFAALVKPDILGDQVDFTDAWNFVSDTDGNSVDPVQSRLTLTTINGNPDVIFRNNSTCSGKLYQGQKVNGSFSWLNNSSFAISQANGNMGSFGISLAARTAGWKFGIEDPSYNTLYRQDVSMSAKGRQSHTTSSFVIPKSTETSIDVNMSNYWTPGSSTYNFFHKIPVVKSNLVVQDIVAVDAATQTVVPHGQPLAAGHEYYWQYTFYNNTNLQVAAEVHGFHNGNADRLSGSVYLIAPYGTVYVDGDLFTPQENQSSVTSRGEIYVYEQTGNLMIDSAPSNNKLSQTYAVQPPIDIDIDFVEPNSGYRAGVEVVSTFRVYNRANVDVLPDSGLTVELEINYNQGGVNKTLEVPAKEVVIPASQDNIVYFKWKVPDGVSSVDMVATASIGSVRKVCDVHREISAVPNSQTPDTKYEAQKPTGWTVPSNGIDVSAITSSVEDRAVWYMWVYNEGTKTFQKQERSILIQPTATVTPDTVVPSAVNKGTDGWQMPSGYGFSFTFSYSPAVWLGEMAPADAYTQLQHGNLYFPEQKYSGGLNQYRTLERTGEQKFELPKNPYATNASGEPDHRRVHFTELWYPDGAYQAKAYIYDLWTPAGMVSIKPTVPKLTIKGSMYDDWYINHRKK